MKNEVMETMDVNDVVENDECTALAEANGESRDNTELVIGLAIGAGATLLAQQLHKRVVKPLYNKAKKAIDDHKAKKAAKAETKEEATKETTVETKFEEVKVEKTEE